MTTLTTPLPRREPLKNSLLDVPPLQDGDRLTRAEFERRYDAMPELKKAELIEGVVHMGSPVSANNHAEPHFDLITLLGNAVKYFYIASVRCCLSWSLCCRVAAMMFGFPA